jgi:hypothetical protein
MWRNYPTAETAEIIQAPFLKDRRSEDAIIALSCCSLIDMRRSRSQPLPDAADRPTLAAGCTRVRAWHFAAGKVGWAHDSMAWQARHRLRVRLRDARAAVKRFRYFTDPLCLLACGLYLLNRCWLRAHVGGPFLRGYFNDLLVIPAALPFVLWLHARLGWREFTAAPTAGETLSHVAVWSFICEVLGPHLNRHAVGDPLDVLCYATGGVFAWLWWQRDRLLVRRLRS